jgi:hypothetical protein
MTYTTDAEHLTSLLLPRDADGLATLDAHANAVRVEVHPARADAPTDRVDADTRCRLVVAIARRLEAAGGFVTVAPGLHPNVFSAIGHLDDRDVIVLARLDDDESDYLAARLADGME